MTDIEKRITELFSNKDMATFVISSFATVLAVGAVFYFLYKATFKSRKCSDINAEYENKTNTLGVTADVAAHPLNDVYIKTAYNCCSLGGYANDYVGTCILTAILKQGVRCLDFEIFSIDNVPVVATSTSTSYHVKETYNSLPFNQVLALIEDQAMSGDIAPNPRDPLFIHLRIKSNNMVMFKALNKMLSGVSRIYNGQVTYSSTLQSLMGKIVVIVSNDNRGYLDAGFAHNMISHNPKFKLYKYDHVQSLSPAEVREMAKPNTLSIITPSAGSNPSNMDINKIINLKCNMVAMKYQDADPQLTNYNAMFSDCAFILKDEISL